MFIALVIAVTQCSLVLSTPELSCNVRKYATFHCNMGGFNNRLSSLLALQIVSKAEDTNGQDAVIATVDSRKVWLSQDIINRNEQRRHYATGQLDPSRKQDAWLKLTVADFTKNDSGTYSCRISYTDHPADTQHSVWSSDLVVDDFVSEPIKAPGFKCVHSRGVHMQCSSGRSDDDDSRDNVTSIEISSREKKWFVSWDNEHNGTNCSSGVLGFYHRQKRSATGSTLEAHIPTATCDLQSDYVCRVTTSSNRKLESQPRRLPLAECEETANTEPPVAHKTTMSVAIPTKEDQLSLGVVIGAVCCVVVLVTLVVVGCVIYCIKRRGSRKEALKAKTYTEEDEDNVWNENTDKSSDTKEPLVECVVKGAPKASSKVADKLLGTEEEKTLLDGSDDAVANKPHKNCNNLNITGAGLDNSPEDRNEKRVVNMNNTDRLQVIIVNEDEGYHSNRSSENSLPSSGELVTFRTSSSSENDDTPEDMKKDLNVNKRNPRSFDSYQKQDEKQSDMKTNSDKHSRLRVPVQATDSVNGKELEV